MMSSLPEDSSSLETMSPYISPISATTSQEEAHSIVGLGISNCGLDRTFDPVTTYPYPISYTPSANTFPANQLLTPSNFYDAPSKLQNIPSDPTCFSVYNGFSDDSLSPLSPYGSHPMSASPSYNSNLELQCSQDSYQRMPGYWDSKPSSGPPMPMETRAVTGDRIPVFQHLPGQGQYCAPMNPAYPSANGGLSDHAPHLKENDKNATNLQASFTHGEPYTPPNTSIDMGTRSPSSKPPQRPRTASAGERIAAGKGFSCPVCGFTFTRKSNCKEHEKRHDPNFKRYFKCSECSKSFARNADLKRHVDNVRHNDPALA